jgi:hypothetical protein
LQLKLYEKVDGYTAYFWKNTTKKALKTRLLQKPVTFSTASREVRKGDSPPQCAPRLCA